MMQNYGPISPQTRQAIAIIGIGCRFPGGITGSESFWAALVNRVDAISEVPANRFDITKYYDPTPRTPGKMVTRFGGFLDNLDRFDADFFRISPLEARWMDPQQRLLLEVSWEALEDAGIPVSRLSGSSTGVFIGAWLQDFESRLVGDPSVDDIDRIDLYATTGSGRYSLAGRLSYFYGLQGPSLVVDTHCSSSLVAVHLA
jgi:myxalamid-type polyketide synthase MxaE and MxaD